MEKYVCSLELAKKLEELGIKQESEYYWIRYYANTKYDLISKKDVDFYRVISGYDEAKRYSAFTVGELGEIIPDHVGTCKIIGFRKNGTVYWSWIDTTDNILITGDTEANCRAKMLIYLLENKLIREG